MAENTPPPIEPTLTKAPRIEVVDALRGFSLAGIVIVHMMENYIAGPIPPEMSDGMYPLITDQIAQGVSEFLIRGKFFALFSFLFGLSFYLQMESGRRRGVNYAGTYLWRILILLAIGYAHSLLYRGDILLLYALLAIPLIPFDRIPKKVTAFLASLLFLGVGRYVVFYLNQGQALFTDINLMDMEAEPFMRYVEILQGGNLAELFALNAWEGILIKFDFQFGIFNRGYLTFGFFLAGLWVGKLDFFRKFREYRQALRWIWISGLGLLLLGLALTILVFMKYPEGPPDGFNTWDLMFGLTGVDLFNLGLTIIILGVFLLVYKTDWGERRLKAFIPYGKMALTNYLVQTLIGTSIYYGYGLGYVGKIPAAWSGGLALLVIALQMWWSTIWLKHFQYGPVEWLWRSLTHLRIYPLRKTLH